MTEPATKPVIRYPLESASSRGVTHLLKGVNNLKGELLTVEKGKCPHTILVTSSLPGEGKTTAALVMARSLTEASHDKVLLIDASGALKPFDGWYKLDHGMLGLSDVLAKTTPLKSILFPTDNNQIDIALYGDSAYGGTHIFESGRFKEVMNDLKNKYDFIIVDGPSFLSSSAAALMTKNFDGLVLVVQCKKTKKKAVQQVMQSIESLGGNVIGTIMNYRTYYLPQWLSSWL